MMYQPYYTPYQNQYGNGAMPDQLGQMRGQQMPMPPQPAPQTQSNSGLIWVQGEAGAKSFLVAPGQTVMLMDSENTVFYLKSADASGMPMPLRVFDYTERVANAQGGSVPVANDGRYITREEFDAKIGEIMNAMKGDKNYGEPTV